MPDFAMWYDSIRQYVTAEPQLYFRMFTDKAFRRQMLSESERPQQHKAMLYFASAHPKITALRFDSIPADRVIFDPQTVGAIPSPCGSTSLGRPSRYDQG